MTQAPPTPIVTRPVAVFDVPASGLSITVTPSAEERAALAAFNGIVAVVAMTATVRLVAEGAQGLRVTGVLDADVTQTCVVSLEPFDSHLSEAIDVHFLTDTALAAYRAARTAIVADDDEPAPDEPDVIEHGQIDIGKLAAEHLTLGLDPYPRRPGAALDIDAIADTPPVSPFAVLRAFTQDRS